MAEDKKSFLLYCDLIHTLKHLPKEKLGELFLHILEYVNDENPVSDDLIINITFEPIKRQLKRDLIKYEEVRERNRQSARKRWDAHALNGMPTDAKNADTVTDTDNDTVTDKEINVSFDCFWDLYDKKVNSKDCKKKWEKLKDEERQKIIDTLPAFLSQIKDKQFQPHPATYLNQKRWNDEGSNSNKKEYKLYSANGTKTVYLTLDELKKEKGSGFWKEQHEI